jgi:PEP-CTERM motif
LNSSFILETADMACTLFTTRLQDNACRLRLVIATGLFSMLTSTAVADFHTSDEPEPETSFGFVADATAETEFRLFDEGSEEWIDEDVIDIMHDLGNGDEAAIAEAVAKVLNPRGSAKVTASAVGRFDYKDEGGRKLHLGLNVVGSASATLSSTGPDESAFGFSELRFFDRTTFAGDGTLPVIGDPDDPTKVLFNFKVDGSINLRGVNYSAVGLSLVATDGDFTSEATYQWSRAQFDSSPSLSTKVTSAGFTLAATLGSEPIDWAIGAFLSGFSSGGRFEANFKHTITLDSITFEDGSTPEERGFSLVFDSGLTSPNLLSRDPTVEPVPEPSTLGLLGLGSLGLCIARPSRRRLKSTPA